MEIQKTKTNGIEQSSSKWKDYSNKCLYFKKIKITNKQPNFIPQKTKKRRRN